MSKRKLEPVDDSKERNTKPTFTNSGILLKEQRIVNGIELKYQEPAEARLPTDSTSSWRLYIFENKEDKKPTKETTLDRQSCYLFGREEKVVDFLITHRSCSKQHAVLQYRQQEISKKLQVKLYLMDLDSTNKTFLNNEKISPFRYYEILPGDIVTFGVDKTEYVFIKE